MLGVKPKAAKTKQDEGAKKEDRPKIQRQFGRLLSVQSLKEYGASRFSYEDSEGQEGPRTCRNCCRSMTMRCKRRAHNCCKAVYHNCRHEFRSIGVEKTPTYKRLVRLGKFGEMSVKEVKAILRKRFAEVQVFFLGEPKIEHGLHKKHKFTSKRIIPVPEGSDGFSLASFVIHNEGSIFEYFEFDESDNKFEIGAGGSSVVYRATERMTHIGRAVKKIHKRDVWSEEFLQNEVAIMKRLDHPNIPKLFEVFEDDRIIHLVMELCEGGDLLDKLLETSHMTEPHAGIVAKVLLAVTNYLHTHDIVHRDIKPENVLFRVPPKEILSSEMLVCDFGFARPASKEDGLMYTKVGSPYYIAPEVLTGDGYTKAADVWSIGAVIYLLLCGYPPFAGETDSETLQLVQKGKFIFPKEHWKTISKPAKHLIAHLMDIEPTKRMNLGSALQHPWIRAKGMHKLEKMRDETVDRLITFHKHHALRKAAMLAIAYQLEHHDLEQLNDLYHSLDLNGDGLLSRTEFMKGVMAVGVDEVFVQEMIKSVDADQSGVVDYSEFIAATLEKETFIKNHGVCLRAFRSFDQDDSGHLGMDEIAEILDMTSADAQQDVEYFFKQIDNDEDGFIDYGEFHGMLEVEIEATRAHHIQQAPDFEEESVVEDEEFDTHIAGHDSKMNVSDKEVRRSLGKEKGGRKSKGKKGKAKPSVEEEEEEAEGTRDDGALAEAEIAADKEAEKEEEEEAERKIAEEAARKKSRRQANDGSKAPA